ncbi:glycine zipper 2TM domain-containing protein [Dokdonella sp.]|uniref:glycine zipper 2TM domain-containing protein n=1 Tax=Dokdonella sp. TaxID=2291710 RepID=UPI003528D0E5
MLNRALSYLLVPTLMLMLGACATTGGNSGSTAGAVEIRSGVIEQMTDVQIDSNHHRGAGAVVGGLVGLGLGSLVGGGTGRDVAQVLGTIGGAIAGNEIQKKHDQPIPAKQIVVRMSNGVLVSVTQPDSESAGLRVGQSIYVRGNGENARITPQ